MQKRKTKHFHENFEAFQKLEQMQREDVKVLDWVDVSYETPTKSVIENNLVKKIPLKAISQQRWDEYRRLLNQIDVEVLSYAWHEPKKRVVRFYIGDGGSLGGGSYGYAYMEHAPPRVSHSYKECMPRRRCYIYLVPNWYKYDEGFRLEQE